MKKRLTAFVVGLLLLMTFLPTTALADDLPLEADAAAASSNFVLTISVVTKLGDQVLEGITGGEVSQQASRFGAKWYLNPSEYDGFSFEGFEGPVYWDNGRYCVDRDGNKAVTAVFKMNLRCFKTLSITTFGDGTVSTDPAGLLMGGKTYFSKDTKVTLTPATTHGWHFVRWGGDTHDNTVKMNKDMTVEAYFEKCVYPVKFMVGAHGTWLNNHTYPIFVPTPYGDTPDDPGIKPHLGYDFTGWSPELAPADEGQEYTAQYACINYPITYDLKGGIAANPESYTIETGSFTLNNPTREGYIFTGWSGTCIPDGTMAVTIPGGSTGARSYAASWKPINYTVTYNINTGDGGVTAPSHHTFDVESNLTANGYYKEGYTFEGWALSAGAAAVDFTDGKSVKNLATTDGAVVELFAVWKIKTFGVSFFQQDGVTQIGQTQTVNWNTAAAAETAPDIIGHTFDKWVLTGDDDTQPDSMTNVKENIKAVASYVRNAYIVNFLDYQGNVIGSDTVLYGDPAKAPAVPTREGYTFIGWDKEFNKITGALVVTAQYKINTYTVKFVNFDSTVLSTQTINHGSAAVAPANPVRSGYTFTSWDKDFSKIVSDLIVTAQYKLNVVSDDEDIPRTYDDSQPFPWLWVAVAAVLSGAIVVIVVSQMKRRKKTGDAV